MRVAPSAIRIVEKTYIWRFGGETAQQCGLAGKNPDDAIQCIPQDRLSTLCGRALGKVLIKLFGAIPEAYKTKPLVYTQCPNPGSPPGTCTMHSSTDDLGKVLVALGKLPAPATNVFLPSPNHSHVITNAYATQSAIWW